MVLKNILIYSSIYIGLFTVTFYILCYLSKSKEKTPEFPEKNPPKVSIIIPAFNEEKGIAGSIENALKIDYPKNKLEIVVVDDGSKDKTYEIALKFKNKGIKVYRLEKNQGKGAAINLGIEKTNSEFLVTMDADNTLPEPDALKKMIAYFENKKVMCVAPAMAIYKPKGILQKIQQIEYLFGVFLRKAFSSINAVHVTPGAFSAYRRIFFEKHGGFEKRNLTEDLEVALRIQSHNYIIENSIDSVIYAVAPKTFVSLMKQRRRWYAGLLKNFWNYRFLFTRKYGSMGLIVLPVAIITAILSIALTSNIIVDSILNLKKEISLLESINFKVLNNLEFSKFILEKYLFLIFSDPIFIMLLVFIGILIGYMIFAKKRVKQYTNIRLSLIFFLLFYSLLFTFWWIVSLFYILFKRKISWR